MPQVREPAPARGAARDTDNCAYVRERLSAAQPETAVFANICAESTDFQLGMERLLLAMRPDRAAGHPLLLAAA